VLTIFFRIYFDLIIVYAIIFLNIFLHFQKSHMLPSGVTCHNACCRSQPCLNGGTCTEHCQSPKKKFTCKCRPGYQGSVCEVKDLTSCTDLRTSGDGSVPESKVYTIKRFANDSGFHVYCDFTDPNRTWTLIESFSLANNNIFMGKSFASDFPHNVHDPLNWSGYRLGKTEMMHVYSKSTLFRATCQFPEKNSSLTPDLVRGRLSDLNPFSSEISSQCHTFDYINIGGTDCESCTSPVYKLLTEHIHMDTSYNTGCSFKHQSDVTGADYFGFYMSRSHSFTCTTTPQSTTQWWFGTH